MFIAKIGLLDSSTLRQKRSCFASGEVDTFRGSPFSINIPHLTALRSQGFSSRDDLNGQGTVPLDLFQRRNATLTNPGIA